MSEYTVFIGGRSHSKSLGNKIYIIDRIVELHPSYGVKNGWSTYTGGMMDSGYWYYRKMIDVDMEELIEFFNKYSDNGKIKIYNKKKG